MDNLGAVSGKPHAATALTAVQREVFDRLLAVGGSRPVTPPGLPAILADRIEVGCAAALERWPENRLWLTKSHFSGVEQCEGFVAARADTRQDSFSPTVAVGIVAHRAIQIAHTHPALTPAGAVDAAIEASRDDTAFAAWWDDQGIGVRSDLLCQMISRAVGFLDAFPPLPPNWVPRFEESIQARIGRLTLSARPDLVLGRPRPDMRQTMFICDFKTGSLGDHHFDEAMFYALVATIRFGTAPFRSTVFSVASGDWSDPDVNADRLVAAADRVAAGVVRYIDVMSGAREPELTAGRWCTWCPARNACSAASNVDVAVQAPTSSGPPTRRQPVPTGSPAPVRGSAVPSAIQTPAPSIFDID